MNTLQLGPQTFQFAVILTQASSLTPDQEHKMSAIRKNSEADSAFQRAAKTLFEGKDLSQGMLILECLQMSQGHVPQSAIDAALGVSTRHLITPDDYITLTTPWSKTVGKAHPDD